MASSVTLWTYWLLKIGRPCICSVLPCQGLGSMRHLDQMSLRTLVLAGNVALRYDLKCYKSYCEAGVAQRVCNWLPHNDPGFDSRPSQGTVNGGAVSKWPHCRWAIKHKQPTNKSYYALKLADQNWNHYTVHSCLEFSWLDMLLPSPWL